MTWNRFRSKAFSQKVRLGRDEADIDDQSMSGKLISPRMMMGNFFGRLSRTLNRSRIRLIWLVGGIYTPQMIR